LSSGGATIYAIIETGGKQYKVSPGQSIKVETLAVAEGATIDLDRVLAISDGDKLVLGKPVVEGAVVTCTSKGDGQGAKVIGGKYKAKVRYFRRIGHRQPYTELIIDSISGAGIKAEKVVKAKAEKAETTETAAEVEKPKRTRAKKAAEAVVEAAPAKAEKPAAKPRRTKKEEK
jgi:large subunit ribosomal protein L21